MSVNSNVAWLTTCAKRLWAGGSMYHDCMDTNPPLSPLIYIPNVILEQATSIPSYYWIFILTCGLIVFSAVITQYLLNRLGWFEKRQSAVLAITLMITMAVLPGNSFAERDHLIAVLYIPFLLAQLCITSMIQTHKVPTYLLFLGGAVCMLTKPPLGLLPTLLIAHRAYKNKTLRVVFDADFIILALTTLAYIGICSALYSDFLFGIMPDIYKLYIKYGNFIWIREKLLMTAGLFLLNLIFYLLFAKKCSAVYFIVLNLAVLNGLLSFTMQMKGMTYHLFPAYACLCQLFLLTVFGGFKKLISENITKSMATNILIVIFVSLFSLMHTPLNTQYPTHEFYKNTIFTQLLNKYCDKDCTYFITYENMDIMSQHAYYSSAEYGSRFPSFWFIPMIYLKLNEGYYPDTPILLPEEANTYKELKKKYFTLIDEDFKRFKPSVIILLDEDFTPFTYKSTASDIMENIMKDYVRVERTYIDRAEFYKKTKLDFFNLMTFDIYVSKESEYYRSLNTQTHDAQ